MEDTIPFARRLRLRRLSRRDGPGLLVVPLDHAIGSGPLAQLGHAGSGPLAHVDRAAGGPFAHSERVAGGSFAHSERVAGGSFAHFDRAAGGGPVAGLDRGVNAGSLTASDDRMGAGSLAGPEHGGSVGPLTHPDHGVGGGPVARLHLDGLLAQLEAAGTDAVILHKGALRRVDPARFRRMSLVLHLNASTALAPDPDAKYPVATVAEALSLGATAVSVHVNIGSATEDKQIAHLAEVAADCARWGMPLLAMMYVRPPAWGPDRIAPNAGRLTPDASRLTPDASRLATDGSRLAPDVGRLAPDVGRHAPDVGRFASDVSRLALDGGRFARDVARFAPDPDQLAHALAVATELGADLVKTALPSSPAAAAQVIRSCPVPVLAAGGAVDGDSLDRLAVAMRAGAGGIAAGRLVFTAPDPGAMARRLAELVSSSSRAPEVLVG